MARAVTLAALLLWFTCVVHYGGAQSADGPSSATGGASVEAALLSLPDACANWEEATRGLPGAPWAAGTLPCGSSPATAWRGIQCDNGIVVSLRLAGLGLEGVLPANLADLPDLQALDLRDNAFRGGIPAAWMQPNSFPALLEADLSGNSLAGTLPRELLTLASQTIRVAACNFSGPLPAAWQSGSLQLLDLSDNELTGTLPSSWGEKTALPSLGQLYLQGNALSGPIPDPQWTSVGFSAPCTVHMRPGNTAVCGPVLPLAPMLYDAFVLDNPLLNSSFVKPQQGLLSNATTLMITSAGLFDPDNQVTISNSLGSCGVPCQSTVIVATNFYDVTWQTNVSAADLLKLNPGRTGVKPGAVLRLACYPVDNDPLAAFLLTPRYFGGDVAYLRFAGGNQRPGLRGLAGAMAASGVNDHLPNQNDFDPPYTGSMGGSNGSVRGELVQPVFWFVDMQSEFQVTSVVVTAGATELVNASIYVGSDTSAVQRNRLVASGLNVAASDSLALPVAGARGRYVIVYTGLTSQGQMSVADLQVYTAETNAAANKPVSVSGVAVSSAGEVVDGDSKTCVPVVADSGSDMAWAAVDLGYRGIVGMIVLSMVPPPARNDSDGAIPQFQVFVKPSGLSGSLADAEACSEMTQPMPAGGGWAVMSCNVTGRVVLVTTPGTSSFQLCELQVGLAVRPRGLDDTSGGGLSAGAIAGIVVGALAAAALVCLGALLCARRRRSRKRPAAAKQASEGKLVKVSSDPGKCKDGLEGAERGDGPDGSESAGGSAPAAAAAALGATVVPLGVAVTSGSETPAPSVPSGFASAESTLPTSPRSAQKCSAASSGPRQGSADCTSSGDGGGQSSGSMLLRDGSATDLSKLPPEFSDVTASEFQLIRPLGEGSFGQVFLARYCETMVAVKMLTHQSVPSPTSSVQHTATLRSLYREASLMSRLRHPNVCQYLGACLDPPCLLMELCSRKSVDVVLAQGLTSSKVARQLSWGRLLSMALDSAKGMLYLHSRTPPIVHRDLKSANLLVDAQWHVRVADFNLSRETGREQASSVVAITNPRWLAPEVLSGQPGQLPADVWAFGTVLWEIATWTLPFGDKANPFQIITQVQSHPTSSGLRIPSPGDLPGGTFPGWPQYVELMEACWERDPAARPTFDAVVQRLRSLLSAELKRQQQLRQEGPATSVDLPPTPRSTPESAQVSPAALSGTTSMLRDGSSGQLPATRSSLVAGPASFSPRNLQATSPFAAASKKEPAAQPPQQQGSLAGAE